MGIDKIKGIVIIDEIEKHLHPLLQRRIIGRLQNKFKGIQFIVSTHSPLCVNGTLDIDSRGWKIVSTVANGSKHDALPKPLPSGLRADQVLVEYFGLDTTLSEKVESIIMDYQKLFSKDNKSRSDDEKLIELGERLEEYDFNLAESVKDIEMQKKLLVMLNNEKVKND